jgi:hypothetical protein
VVERGQSCYREVLYGLAPGLPDRLSSDEARRKFLEELRELTRGIAHATSLVATMALMVDEQAVPPDAESEAYVRAVVGWVCSPQDRAGK